MLTQAELYKVFLAKLSLFRRGEWHLVLFEGSPTEDSYSWCPDCIFTLAQVKKFQSSYGGPIAFLQFKVGSKKEWQEEENKFRKRFPYLKDLPTVILFRGQEDVARIVAPEQKDLLFLCKRTEIYERQIKAGIWNPPKKVTL